MAKLTKAEAKQHAAAVERLQQDTLTHEDRLFVFRHWHEGAESVNGERGAFFTPVDLAFDFALELGFGYSDQQHTAVDLCAGIGVLAYAAMCRNPTTSVTCIELNPAYVEVGRKLVPEANWLCLDLADAEAIEALGRFDVAMSNPPFGSVRSFRDVVSPVYTGKQAEYKVIDIAARLAPHGVFILPQQSSGFAYSGVQTFERTEVRKYQEFTKQTGIALDIGMGIDTTYCDYGQFKGTKPLVEIACADFEDSAVIIPPSQATLFAA